MFSGHFAGQLSDHMPDPISRPAGPALRETPSRLREGGGRPGIPQAERCDPRWPGFPGRQCPQAGWTRDKSSPLTGAHFSTPRTATLDESGGPGSAGTLGGHGSTPRSQCRCHPPHTRLRPSTLGTGGQARREARRRPQPAGLAVKTCDRSAALGKRGSVDPTEPTGEPRRRQRHTGPCRPRRRDVPGPRPAARTWTGLTAPCEEPRCPRGLGALGELQAGRTRRCPERTRLDVAWTTLCSSRDALQAQRWPRRPGK